ncbi:acyltransferase [Frankia sp. AiPs1]|uniref:acyltransferase family protein n=1 Tax=Frankia sp. AiPs1 TaxID=573493 RepID=UPI002043D306|nr:acyltransferase [Frankia sp. AiPs1]MCM3922017.1 acyltransferase [Frankia sp. AiPs1]
MSRQQPRQTLGSAFDPRRNSFGFLRIGLALVVFVQHGLAAGGFAPAPTAQYDPAVLAVDCFFVISGFLITRSRVQVRSTPRFLWHRFLRVLPGFWVCLVVVAMVIAPLGWLHEHRTLAGYFGSHPHGPFTYLTANSLLAMRFYDIAGTPRQVPIARMPGGPVAWDGSLWTLFWEALCYLGIAALGAYGLLRRRRAVVGGLTVALWVVWVLRWSALERLPTLLASDLAGAAVRLGSLFLAGALLYLYADRVPFSSRLGLLAVALTAAGLLCPDGHTVISLPLAYVCVWAALRLPLWKVAARDDLSYGTYIYSAPVQQLFAVYGLHRLGLVPYFLTCLAATTMLALASWRLVERPALRLKNRSLPGPGGWAVLARLRHRRLGAGAAGAAAIPAQRRGGGERAAGADEGPAERAVLGEQQQSEQDPQEKGDAVGGQHR